jgi:hypothetical protein
MWPKEAYRGSRNIGAAFWGMCAGYGPTTSQMMMSTRSDMISEVGGE